MQFLSVAHTRRDHRRHGSVSHVWQGRFKAPVVQETSYVWTVLASIEANPVRAGLVADGAGRPWSSDRAHAEGADDRLLTPLPEWSEMGGDETSRRAWWRQKLTTVLNEEHPAKVRQTIVSGQPLGDPEWVEARTRELHPGPVERRRPGRPRRIGDP